MTGTVMGAGRDRSVCEKVWTLPNFVTTGKDVPQVTMADEGLRDDRVPQMWFVQHGSRFLNFKLRF